MVAATAIETGVLNLYESCGARRLSPNTRVCSKKESVKKGSCKQICSLFFSNCSVCKC